ncbi:MAG: acyltransferase [Phycisphaerae bacterium]|nr:acyltransferase [Phycisphaerae bacterium]
MMPRTSSRQEDIDIARAIAQFIVVLNHIPQYFQRYHLDHLDSTMCRWILTGVNYLHMPTFMLVAGYVLAGGRDDAGSLEGYWRFERKKLCRLILPFLSISLMTLAIKMVLPGDSARGAGASLLGMVTAPRSGVAPHLWFLWCLMSIFLVWPLIRRVIPEHLLPWVWGGLIVLAVWPIPWPTDVHGSPVLGLADLIWYLPMFMLGYLCRKRWHRLLAFGAKAALVAGAVALAAMLVVVKADTAGLPRGDLTVSAIRFTGHVAGGLCVLSVAGLIASRTVRPRAVLAGVGRRSYDIYLLHVALVGHPLVLVISRLHPGPVETYVYFAVALVATMVVPIGIGELIRRVPLLACGMLGVPMRRASASQAL